MPILRPQTELDAYRGLTAYAGDIHNHCGISYGHGTLEDAYRNAALQLDFASVTGHASWHDMPAAPAHVNAYHRAGFARLESQWEDVQELTEAVNDEGKFVSFLSFEWHSMTYGDHCVYFNSGRGPLHIAQAESLDALRGALRTLHGQGLASLVLPHHIGYQEGRRGIAWRSFTEEFSPVVELVSMHGSGEDDRSPRPYLHTMGPRDVGSTAITGLKRGHRFGFIGSTDHHSAHPGSYGYGRAMVWARDLTRASIWEAIRARRTYAVTGDRIMLATAVNGAPMGATVKGVGRRQIEVSVHGGGALDYVEVVRNGDVIARVAGNLAAAPTRGFSGILSVAMGWGEIDVVTNWDVELEVIGGRILSVEPRFRGYDVVAPTDKEPDRFSFSEWTQPSERTIRLRTQSRGNPTVLTDATQQFALQVEGDERTVLVARVNGHESSYSVADLMTGPRVVYQGAFLSGAFVFNRAEPEGTTNLEWELEDEGSPLQDDWYYVRVRQYNDQYAWSSPTWVDGRR
ncbi:MAG TPA: DUF3604 domain-containing protein [Cellulomonas sp.]|uniref:DUF3604 domain-containing protein n=1 Tax=Cellulomonas sp. TaxID=40001 RepID=UPI002E3296BB|nr:DUF3604 domain-containing protein [Cellulomonas sp.]HEX5331343.1 DUF3604 domain-containing protein [Cellulomonas sp.]